MRRTLTLFGVGFATEAALLRRVPLLHAAGARGLRLLSGALAPWRAVCPTARGRS